MYSYGNGFGCAVAQFIKNIKDDVGNVYIEQIDSDDEEWIDLNYIVDYNDKDKFYSVKISCFGKEFFNGSMKEFLEFCKNPVYDEEVRYE